MDKNLFGIRTGALATGSGLLCRVQLEQTVDPVQHFPCFLSIRPDDIGPHFIVGIIQLLSNNTIPCLYAQMHI